MYRTVLVGELVAGWHEADGARRHLDEPRQQTVSTVQILGAEKALFKVRLLRSIFVDGKHNVKLTLGLLDFSY